MAHATTSYSDRILGILTNGDTEVRFPRATRVKNKTTAPIQITAEQILLEAGSEESETGRPKRTITDSHELLEYRLRKRKEFEDLIRRVRWNHLVWVKYATWEASQEDFARARSVYERALGVFHSEHTLWLRYAEFEMRHGFVNHARNVWDRAVSLLPRVDQLWYKYIHMEEVLGDVANARQVFERWMGWRPATAGWNSYIKFELRYGEVERARALYGRFVREHPRGDTFIQYAKFEKKQGEVERARRVYERAVDILAEEEDAEVLFAAFFDFEEDCSKGERARRAIYNYGLDRLPKGQAKELSRKFLAFEKPCQFGYAECIEDAFKEKRKFQYEEEVTKNPLNYDSWFDYIRLEESVGMKDRIREAYERAIANVPPVEEKQYWQRYIYFWINYALYEELSAQDMDRTRDVYSKCLKLIPHKKFSFAKIWLMAAQFEIRQKNLNGTRQILGNAIGMTLKGKIFKKYIEIGLQLGNMDRCRTLYEKYIEWAPANCYAWRKYAELEKNLCEADRARSIYELAIAQPTLDTPEVLWKEYLQFEIGENEFDKTRQLYERLLERTKHLKVWLSYAEFEASVGDDGMNDMGNQDQQMGQVQRCRAVFERAFEYFRTRAPELREERAMLLEDWLNKEVIFGSIGDVSLVQKKAPRKVKRKRPITTETGNTCFNLGYEEYVDYIFPDEVAPYFKILEVAYKWKKLKVGDDDAD